MRVSRALLAKAAHNAELKQWLNVGKYSSRVHILDRGICDESLKLIRDTLPEEQTCDIIDINPGMGVWSEALHEVLQPRRHVLVEPHKDQYARWLDPLLNRPESAYRYAPNLVAAMQPKNALLSPEVLKLGEKLEEDWSQGKKSKVPTDMLLITANLANTFHKVAGFQGSEAKRFLNLYYQSLFSGKENTHRYGLVRMLAWVDSNTKRVIVPTSVAGQTKQSVQFDSAFSVQVVTSPLQHHINVRHLRRWYDLDAENFRKVVNDQRKTGVEYPANRQPTPPSPPLSFFEPSVDFVIRNCHQFPESALYVEQLLALHKLLSQAMPEWMTHYEEEYRYRAKHGQKQGRLKGHKIESENQLLYRKLVTQLRTHHNEWKKVSKIIHEHRALWKRFSEAYGRGLSFEPGSSEEADELLREYGELLTKTKRLKYDSRVRVVKAIDDYRGYDASPRAMSWNRRVFEPLPAQQEEFHPPRKALSLLDMQPRQEHVDKLDTLDKQICFYYVVTSMCIYLGDTVTEAIKRLVPAGHEEFIKGIKELDNIPKGGWHDIENLRIRSLHHSYWMQIALAYEKWPHRPAARQLLAFSTTMFDAPL